MMPADNIVHYILYAAILIIFFIVLRSPKKNDRKKDRNTKDEK